MTSIKRERMALAMGPAHELGKLVARSSPLSATALILISSPAARAASMPSSTLARSPQRVRRRKRAGSSVSSETLTRLTPQSASSFAWRVEKGAVGRERQLLESAAREMARERAEKPHHIAPHERLASREAQLRGAAPTKAEHSRSSSSSVSRSRFGRKLISSFMQ